MSRRIATAALLIAWLCANGALWDAMQVAAWSKMFAAYSETMSVTDAVRETFDASKPCDMCLGIAKAKGATEKKIPTGEQGTSAKFVLVIHVVDTPIFSQERDLWPMAQDFRVRERFDPVPVPPPRV